MQAELIRPSPIAALPPRRCGLATAIQNPDPRRDNNFLLFFLK